MQKNLRNAVRDGDVDLVQDCLHKGAAVHYKDGEGMTPLHQAAVKGYTDVTKVLLEAGASVSAVDKLGQTPLHKAAWDNGNPAQYERNRRFRHLVYVLG